MRIALGLEYDGRPYAGWQIQKHAPSVQACVEAALARIADHPVRVQCAGRTDTGVHAYGQVVHFDTDVQRPLRAWVFGGNVHLPDSISINWAVPVPDDFHARFSARRRIYRYVILNRASRPGLMAHRVTWECRALDVEVLRAASRCLIGEHDFSAFRAQNCQASTPIRTLHRLDVARAGDFIFLEFEANAFLYHMVRNIAGVLMRIGRHEAPPEWAADVLKTRKRALAGMTAPPFGLYFVGARYEGYDLPEPTAVNLRL